jgi:hypothetical protein
MAVIILCAGGPRGPFPRFDSGRSLPASLNRYQREALVRLGLAVDMIQEELADRGACPACRKRYSHKEDCALVELEAAMDHLELELGRPDIVP